MLKRHCKIKLFFKEADFVKNMFSENGYPAEFCYACVNKFINDKCSTESKHKVIEDKVQTILFVPYIGLPSAIFGR